MRKSVLITKQEIFLNFGVTDDASAFFLDQNTLTVSTPQYRHNFSKCLYSESLFSIASNFIIILMMIMRCSYGH